MSTNSTEIPVVTGKSFSLVHAGAFKDLHQYKIKHPKMDREARGKLFLNKLLGLTGMEVSFGKLPAGAAIPFLHKHKLNEELYIFVGGKGQIQIDGEILDVSEGTAVRISPDGARSARSSSDEDLYYIVIQAKEGSLGPHTFDDGVPVDQPVTW